MNTVRKRNTVHHHRVLPYIVVAVLAPFLWVAWSLVHDANTSIDSRGDRLSQLHSLTGESPSVAVDAPLPPIDNATIATLVATVPRLVVVRLNDNGKPTQILTNTLAPPTGDEQIVAVQNNHQVTVTAQLVTQIIGHHYKGNWSVPGAWHKW